MIVDESHYDLLRDAIFDNDRSRVAELLSVTDMNVDHFDAGGQTLLHLASFWGRMDIVKLLLSAGASMKTKNAAGCTALDLAVHWGHSAVAEVIRLRGGSSVWEDKLGMLQTKLEDANLRIAHLQGRYDEKSKQCTLLADDVHALDRALEEEKSAHVLTAHRLEEVKLQVVALESTLRDSQQSVDRLSGELQGALLDKANADSSRERAKQDARDLLTHRNEILTKMQESVTQQEQTTYNWQRAEAAAAMADSQRNFALAERDRYQKRHGAAVGELATTMARLASAETELMELKTDLAEFIYEFTRAKRSKKRATKALASMTAPRGIALQREGPRAVTAPAQASVSSVSRVAQPEHGKSLAPAALIAEVSAGEHPDLAITHGIVYPKKHKKQFSLAAREFGDRLRADEQRKQQQRVKELQRMENQFLADGLQVRVAEADQFQEAFVSTVRAFSTARADRWKQLKRERDLQSSFATGALDRSISIAPAGAVSTESVGDLPGDVPAERSKLSSTSMPDLNYQVYGKYAGAATHHRPITSPLETKMQASFFSIGASKADDPRVTSSTRKQQDASSVIDSRASDVVSLPFV